MSSISIYVPTLQINENDLQNVVSFIYKHEDLLKEFGGIKIQPNPQCKLALKKRRKNLKLNPTNCQIVKMSKEKGLYCVKKIDQIEESPIESALITDELNFWTSLSNSTNKQRQLNTSLLHNKSFFYEKTSRIYFDIHRLPSQSLLKLGGRKLIRQYCPYVKRSHGPGGIYPLHCAQDHLLSFDYHHEGGRHHWYIIPNREREILTKRIYDNNLSLCLDHGQLLIDPSLLDKYHIRYHRIIQNPNEFVVLSCGTLAQSFTEDSSWSESIDFALPSWIQDGHSNSTCQCNLSNNIEISLFRHELIEKYISSHLNINNDYQFFTLKGSIIFNYI